MRLPYTIRTMASDTYEVEIKSLLGSEERATQLRNDLQKIDPACTKLSSYTQLNHYFEGGDPVRLVAVLAPYLSTDITERMNVMAKGEKISIRSREMNGQVKIVMKASVGSDSSENGVARMEIEERIASVTLAQLDELILSAGYRYQAKWSRTREEYKVKDISVCLDKNAGYGYLAEFEKVVDAPEKTGQAQKEVSELMSALGVMELPQDRLERMFAHYNLHWPEYYGTENIFTIE